MQYAKECTEHHALSPTLHQFAAATQSINSNKIVHFGAFHFVTGEQTWWRILVLNFINQSKCGIEIRTERCLFNFAFPFSCQMLGGSLWLCSAVFVLLRTAAEPGWSAFRHKAQPSSAAVLCHHILPRPLVILAHKGGWKILGLLLL